MRLNKALGVSEKVLESNGVFNSYVGVDSRLYIDPALLRDTDIPEFKESYKKITDHFLVVLKMVLNTKKPNDAFAKKGVDLLLFKEINAACLGYSDKSGGAGWGPVLAASVFETALQIAEAGIQDPTIFEIMGLFEEKIGGDHISDMALSICLDDFVRFNKRIAAKLRLELGDIDIHGTKFQLPLAKRLGKPVLLIPASLLDDLPVALDWSEISSVSGKNYEIRKQISQAIGLSWSKFATLRKDQKKKVVLKEEGLLEAILKSYKEIKASVYDLSKDVKWLLKWAEIAEDFAGAHPLVISRPTDLNSLFKVAQTICEKFGQGLRYNGLNLHLYQEDEKLRHERYPQLLFLALASSYTDANDIDLTREPNKGRGPVDFKLSKGASKKVLVELKYSSNPKLVKGYTDQLSEYMKSEEASRAIYLIIQVDDMEADIKKVIEIGKDAKKKSPNAPEVIVVDGRIYPSASKMLL